MSKMGRTTFEACAYLGLFKTISRNSHNVKGAFSFFIEFYRLEFMQFISVQLLTKTATLESEPCS